MLTCPVCQQGLTEGADIAITCPCGLVYPRLTSGGIDFLRGEEFKDFDWNPVDTAQQEMLEQEAVGIAWRIESFIIPLFGRFSRATKRDPRKLAVLDCGCGSGLSVDILNAHGIPAFGIDAGEARHRQWDVRSFSNRLHSANALHLPFGTGSFDVVFSSGLIEHIGIHEQEAGTYQRSAPARLSCSAPAIRPRTGAGTEARRFHSVRPPQWRIAGGLLAWGSAGQHSMARLTGRHAPSLRRNLRVFPCRRSILASLLAVAQAPAAIQQGAKPLVRKRVRSPDEDLVPDD